MTFHTRALRCALFAGAALCALASYAAAPTPRRTPTLGHGRDGGRHRAVVDLQSHGRSQHHLDGDGRGARQDNQRGHPGRHAALCPQRVDPSAAHRRHPVADHQPHLRGRRLGPDAALCGRHPDLRPDRQQQHQRLAEVGPDHARRRRPGRRAERPLRGGLPRQLGGQRHRVYDPHAQPARSPRRSAGREPGVLEIRRRRQLFHRPLRRRHRRPARPARVPAELQPPGQPQPAADLRHRHGPRRVELRGNPGDRRLQRRQPHQRAHRGAGLQRAGASGAGQRVGASHLRFHPQRDAGLHLRPVRQQRRLDGEQLPARRGRGAGLRRGDQHRGPRLQRRRQQLLERRL